MGINGVRQSLTLRQGLTFDLLAALIVKYAVHWRFMGRPLHKIMQRGHKKVHYSQRNAHLLMILAGDDPKKIAKLLSHWLHQDTPSNSR
jgi:hypothetical protein